MKLKLNLSKIKGYLDFGFSTNHPLKDECDSYADQFGNRVSSGSGWGIRDIQIELANGEDGPDPVKQSELFEEIEKETFANDNDPDSYVSLYYEYEQDEDTIRDVEWFDETGWELCPE